MLGVLVTGCLTAPGPDASPASTTGGASRAQSYTWDAGEFTGTFVARLNVTADTPADCRITYNATGESPERTPMYAMLVEIGGVVEMDRISRTQSSLQPTAHAEAAGAKQDLGAHPLTRWIHASEWDFRLDPDVEARILVGAEGIAPLPPEEHSRVEDRASELANTSVHLRLDCSREVAVGRWEGSADLRFFQEGQMDGGASVHVGVLDATGVSAGSQFQAESTATTGVLAVALTGDLFLTHASAGFIDIEYPGGSDQWVDRPRHLLLEHDVLGAPIDQFRVYEGGAGAYSVTANWASVEITGMLYGFFAGLSPVRGLETLWTEAAP